MASGHRPRVGSFMAASLFIFEVLRDEVNFEADDPWSEFVAALVLFREHHDQFSLEENPFLTPTLMAAANAVEPDREHKYWDHIAHIAIPFGVGGFDLANPAPAPADPPIDMVTATTATQFSPLPGGVLLSRD